MSTGQGLLGNNMFAYCLNNPTNNIDPTGTRVEIWPTLFEDHDPGFIHRMVQDHIVWNGLLFERELYLKGIGRADIYYPETGEVWEIKHGGSSIDMHEERTQSAIQQVNKYIQNSVQIQLKIGHAGAFTGAFVLNHGNISYCVSYDTPQPGAILYYVQKMERYEPAAAYAYATQRSEYLDFLGAMMAFTFLGGSSGSLSPVYSRSYPY